MDRRPNNQLPEQSRKLRSRLAWDLTLILATCLIVLFGNLGAAQYWDRDEPRNAGCAAEMTARGDWVVPIFNDQLRHQKPVMLYWLIMSANAMFGESEFAGRFWSAVLGTGTVLLTYAIGWLLFSQAVGRWSALVLCTTLMFGVASRAATPDATLIFFMTAALTIFVASNRWTVSTDQRIQFPQPGFAVFGFYLMLALAVLTKGLAGFVIPMAIVGLYLLFERLPPLSVQGNSESGLLRRLLTSSVVRIWHPVHFIKTLFSMKPLIGVLVLLAVAGPWYVWVGLRTEGDFLRRFFLEEHLGRATTSFENHSGGWWYYPVAIMVGFFPWSILTWPVVNDHYLTRKVERNRSSTFLLCWIAVQVGIFSLVATKLPSYVTPCFPALAVIVGASLNRFAMGLQLGKIFWFRLSFVTLAIVAALIASGLGFVAHRFVDGKWQLALIAIPLFVGAVWGFISSKSSSETALRILAASAIAFCTLLWSWATVVVDSTRESQLVLEKIKAHDPGLPVAAYRCLESTWVVYGQHPIHELSMQPPTDLADARREKNWKPLPQLAPETFALLHPEALFITTDEHFDELRARLPKDYVVEASAPYFLRDKRLILLAKKPGETRTAGKPTDQQ
ncbi:MAG: glycosyltransferase family 39 protein [Pirellulaceae bacterium]